eukprot:CAMPEP_0175474622 /NCGR_PEP_ID=MMETSP0095-20121207/74988_1 /TAXON_ID=311494 /ORGANISM="Alexandrium monilatum, Strain CCMP3105" /LENGTH=266 /DNA_ID=CAMNT_0016776147 /DNA_START=266 /DNA_END=1063 /DNA_ORIENTATION=-
MWASVKRLALCRLTQPQTARFAAGDAARDPAAEASHAAGAGPTSSPLLVAGRALACPRQKTLRVALKEGPQGAKPRIALAPVRDPHVALVRGATELRLGLRNGGLLQAAQAGGSLRLGCGGGRSSFAAAPGGGPAARGSGRRAGGAATAAVPDKLRPLHPDVLGGVHLYLVGLLGDLLGAEVVGPRRAPPDHAVLAVIGHGEYPRTAGALTSARPDCLLAEAEAVGLPLTAIPDPSQAPLHGQEHSLIGVRGLGGLRLVGVFGRRR